MRRKSISLGTEKAKAEKIKVLQVENERGEKISATCWINFKIDKRQLKDFQFWLLEHDYSMVEYLYSKIKDLLDGKRPIPANRYHVNPQSENVARNVIISTSDRERLKKIVLKNNLKIRDVIIDIISETQA